MTAPLRQIAASSTFASSWTNFDGTSSVYLTASPTFNQIILSLDNLSGGNGRLHKGTPAAHGKLPQGQSALYVFFDGLLGNEEIEAIEWVAQGSVAWDYKYFKDLNKTYCVLAPTEDVDFGSGTKLAFALERVLAATPNTRNMSLQLQGVSGLKDGTNPVNQILTVHVLNAPSKEKKTLALLVGLAGGNTLYTNTPDTGLCLYLTNPLPEPLVPGAASWEQQPAFQLTLVYGDEAGALTTLALASGIELNIRNDFGNAWEPVVKKTQGSEPYWVMQPSANGGGNVLGTGQQATVAFDLTGIDSQVPAGLTYAYISYRNIPGYNDGYYAVEILKVDPLRISLSATPDHFDNPLAPGTSRLDFTVENAGYVSISNSGYARKIAVPRFSDHVDVQLESTTIYTLTAVHAVTGDQLAQSIKVRLYSPAPGFMPRRTIILWYGDANQVPAGWALCNGQNGTPDLRGRFVVGAEEGGMYPPRSKGGGELYLRVDQLPPHDHEAVLGQDGQHHHSSTVDHRGFETESGGGQGLTDSKLTNSNFTFNTNETGLHSHPIKIYNTGLGNVIDIVSCYYALYYIMRV